MNSPGYNANSKHQLADGPFHGEKLHILTTGSTLEFTAKGQTGYYDENYRWHGTSSVMRAKALGYPVKFTVRDGGDRTTDGTIGQP